jgi:hypothetical protein
MTQKLRLKIGEYEMEAEGEDSFIERHRQEFFRQIPAGPKPGAGDVPTTAPKKGVQSAGMKGYSAAEFYKQKRPDGGTKSLIVLGKYLHDSSSREEFSRADIKTLCGQIRIKDIHSQYYTLALKQGWMRETEKGFAITLSGDELVEKMGNAPHPASLGG